MSRLGKRGQEKNGSLRRKRKKRERPLNAGDINRHLVNSTTFLGTITMKSFNSIVIKLPTFSFIVLCNGHWICVYCSKNSFEIFDTLGFLKTKGCVSEGMLKFINVYLSTRNLKASHVVQSNQSVLCGYYCLYFILLRELGHSFEQIMSTFSSVLSENDKLVKSFVNKVHV